MLLNPKLRGGIPILLTTGQVISKTTGLLILQDSQKEVSAIE